MDFDDLEMFLNWWLNNRIINTPSDNSIVCQKDTHGVVLYRHGQYQVELFVVKPNSEIVPHIHPNVDSYEVYVSGDIKFTRDNEVFDQTAIGMQIRVKPSNWHGGLFGARGGVFLSVQKWLNGVNPTFVGDDWTDKNNNTQYKNS